MLHLVRDTFIPYHEVSEVTERNGVPVRERHEIHVSRDTRDNSSVNSAHAMNTKRQHSSTVKVNADDITIVDGEQVDGRYMSMTEL